MTSTEFAEIVKQSITRTIKTMDKKRSEYSNEQDVFANFNKSAHYLGTDNVGAAWCFMVKHLTSLQDICLARGDHSPELIREKLGDIHNYLWLIEAMLEEKQNETIQTT